MAKQNCEGLDRLDKMGNASRMAANHLFAWIVCALVGCLPLAGCQASWSVHRLDDEAVRYARGSHRMILEADLGPAENHIPPPLRSAGYSYPVRVITVLLDSPAFDPPKAVRDYNSGPSLPPGRYLLLVDDHPYFIRAEKIEPGSPRLAEVRDGIARSAATMTVTD